MTRKSNREYYEEREAAARAAAKAATVPQATVLHMEMAYRYAAKALEEGRLATEPVTRDPPFILN